MERIEQIQEILRNYVIHYPRITHRARFGDTEHLHPNDVKFLAQQIAALPCPHCGKAGNEPPDDDPDWAGARHHPELTPESNQPIRTDLEFILTAEERAAVGYDWFSEYKEELDAFLLAQLYKDRKHYHLNQPDNDLPDYYRTHYLHGRLISPPGNDLLLTDEEIREELKKYFTPDQLLFPTEVFELVSGMIAVVRKAQLAKDQLRLNKLQLDNEALENIRQEYFKFVQQQKVRIAKLEAVDGCPDWCEKESRADERRKIGAWLQEHHSATLDCGISQYTLQTADVDELKSGKPLQEVKE